jgi:hypothetical protein
VARAGRHFVAGADGTGRMEVVRDGAALCAPGPREALLRGRTHRAAGIQAHRGGSCEKHSKKRYVFATVGTLSARKFLIKWRASSPRDRRRCAPASNLACGQVVELGLFMSGVRIGGLRPNASAERFPDRVKMARPERFELPTSWFVARRSIQLSYGRKGREYYHIVCRWLLLRKTLNCHDGIRKQGCEIN